MRKIYVGEFSSFFKFLDVGDKTKRANIMSDNDSG